MRLVLDNSVLGFLLFSKPKAGQEPLAACARRLVEEGHELLVPAPALAEALAWLPEPNRMPALRALLALPGLKVVPFDQATAVVASGLRPGKFKERTHQKVKVDVQIIAAAVLHRADGICSTDDDFARVVKASRCPQRVGPPTAFVHQIPLPV